MNEQQIEEALNELIAEAVKKGGYVYIVDKKQNNFVLRLTEPIKIRFINGFKGETDNGGKQ